MITQMFRAFVHNAPCSDLGIVMTIVLYKHRESSTTKFNMG